MKPGWIATLAVAVFAGCTAAAQAAPPTVVPSPGYDARLQEQRAASGATATPVVPAKHRHAKRKTTH